MMKFVAFLVFAVSAWLAYGASSLHQKDPARYGTTPMLVLGAIALVALLSMFFGKSTAKSKSSN